MKRRGIQNIVIPGGLTPYVQAGDLGIYKSFKEIISPIIIAAWKISNPNPKSSMNVTKYLKPSLEVVGAGPHTSEWISSPTFVVLDFDCFGILVLVDLA
jgi:hypothetical protein